MKRLALSLAILLSVGTAASAHFTKAMLSSVYVHASPNTPLPVGLSFIALDGHTTTLAAAIGNRPAVMIFADYTCKTLCGPILAFAASGLTKSGLAPGRDFHLVVIGLDPKDTAADARAMKVSRIGSGTPLAGATIMLAGNAGTLRTLTKAAGYHYAYDEDADQFAHPAAAYVLTPEGRIARVLSGLGLDGNNLRLALVDAGQGRVGTITDRIRLLCYCFDPATGIYSTAISRLLLAGGVATVLALAGGIALLTWRARRGATS
jgi:protein SCO1/2